MEAPLEETCSQAEPGSASCVQRFDDSLNSAIRTTYRISLRSSSLREPRYPSTRVVCCSTRVERTHDLDQTLTSGQRSRARLQWGTRAREVGLASAPHAHGCAATASGSAYATTGETHITPHSHAVWHDALRSPRRGRERPGDTTDGTQRVRVERPVMILPQVHLRKPCYDFSFL